MELPDDVFTSFWSVDVHPDVVCTVTVPAGAHCTVSNASCGMESTKPDTGRVNLYIKTPDTEETLLVPFIMNSFESTMLDLSFSDGDKFQFYTTGVSCHVFVTGYVSGSVTLDIDNPIPKPGPLSFDNRLLINLSVPSPAPPVEEAHEEPHEETHEEAHEETPEASVVDPGNQSSQNE